MNALLEKYKALTEREQKLVLVSAVLLIIALFYTTELSTISIIIASIALSILFTMNRMGVASKAAYILVGVVLWVSVLKSGVHATLAGGNTFLNAENVVQLNAELFQVRSVSTYEENASYHKEIIVADDITARAYNLGSI